MENGIGKVIAYYAGIIIRNQGFMIQILANLQQNRKATESYFNYGKNMIEFGTKVTKSAKEENNAQKNHD